MTDSLSMMNTLAQYTGERLADRKRDLEKLQARQLRIFSTEAGSERDISADWIAKLSAWVLEDEALLARLPGP